MTDSLKVVPFPKGEKVPPEVIESLEKALQSAKDGSLRECILSFTYDGDSSSVCPEDGDPLLPMIRACWRCDGRLDSIHSELEVMAYDVLLELTGRA